MNVLLCKKYHHENGHKISEDTRKLILSDGVVSSFFGNKTTCNLAEINKHLEYIQTLVELFSAHELKEQEVSSDRFQF